jgi:adenosine deaminase
VTDDDLVALPKAHLHLHLTGGMRRSTLVELAATYGVRLPERLVDDHPELRALGWPRFQRLYELARGVLRQPADIRRLLHEIAVDESAAGSEWLELQVTPTGYVPRFGDVVTVVELLCDAAAAAERATGVGVRLVIAANRTRPPWEAELLARLAVRHRDHGVVGFGLSNDERIGSAPDFAKAFRLARDGGLVAVPHAGELRGPDEVSLVLDALAPRRLGHGVRAAEDPAVLRRLADAGVACEVCPASNVALGVFSTAQSVPVRALESAGVPVVLASDDPLLFGAGLVEQYRTVRDEHGYRRSDLARLALASVEHSTMPEDRRRDLADRIADWERAGG